MINFIVKDVEYNIPSTYAEITLEEFQVIASLLEVPTIDTWAAIIAYLCGITDEEVLDFPMEIFNWIIANSFKETEYDLEPTWNGLIAKSELTNINTRTMVAIERAFKRPSDIQLAIVATVFVNPEMSDAENLKEEAIESRIDAVRKMPANQAIPFIIKVGQLYLNHIKSTRG